MENAIYEVPPGERTPLQVALAKAFFSTGDLPRAEQTGCEVLNQGTRLAELLAIVATCRIGQGKADHETKRYLEEALQLSPTSDVKSMIDTAYAEMSKGNWK